MALEDYLEPEVGVAIALTAAFASPKVRGVLRRGAVYGLAGVLTAGDALVSLGRGVKRGAQAAVPEATSGAEGADGVPGEDPPETEAAETPHRRTRKSAEAGANE